MVIGLIKTDPKKEGYNELSKIGESSLKLLEFGMVHLGAGKKEVIDTVESEMALIILGGRCSIKSDDFEWKNIGARRDVFGGAAYSVFVPRRKRFEISTKDHEKVKIAVFKSPTDEDSEPFLVKPSDVLIKTLGTPGWQREAHFIIDEKVPAKHLYIGEAYVKPGNWASYPPHRHEIEDLPDEAFSEELYYYEFNMKSGFGIQKVYTEDGQIDKTYTVKTGDFVEIPRGYHPFGNAPGYTAYYLWGMAGKTRGFYMKTDPNHLWIIAAERMIV
jgi:5-deoxy-glucuronate isomerase